MIEVLWALLAAVFDAFVAWRGVVWCGVVWRYRCTDMSTLRVKCRHKSQFTQNMRRNMKVIPDMCSDKEKKSLLSFPPPVIVNASASI
jgi:hypothetical protein